MKKIVILFLVIVSFILVSCRCPKCKPIVQVSYVVPEFVCPVPEDSALNIKATDRNMLVVNPVNIDGVNYITLEEHYKVNGYIMDTQGGNLKVQRDEIILWRGMYYTCIENIIRLYKKKTDIIEKENDSIPQ